MSEAVNVTPDGMCHTIKAQYYKNSIANFCSGSHFAATGGAGKVKMNNTEEYAIRKLTPIECWRLMGFSDEDFITAKIGDRDKAKELMEQYKDDNVALMDVTDKIKKVSNTQLYKQAGNSIVTNVLYYIYKELYKAMPYLFDDLKVGSYFSGIGAFEIGLNKLYSEIQ